MHQNYQDQRHGDLIQKAQNLDFIYPCRQHGVPYREKITFVDGWSTLLKSFEHHEDSHPDIGHTAGSCRTGRSRGESGRLLSGV